MKSHRHAVTLRTSRRDPGRRAARLRADGNLSHSPRAPSACAALCPDDIRSACRRMAACDGRLGPASPIRRGESHAAVMRNSTAFARGQDERTDGAFKDIMNASGCRRHSLEGGGQIDYIRKVRASSTSHRFGFDGNTPAGKPSEFRCTRSLANSFIAAGDRIQALAARTCSARWARRSLAAMKLGKIGRHAAGISRRRFLKAAPPPLRGVPMLNSAATRSSPRRRAVSARAVKIVDELSSSTCGCAQDRFHAEPTPRR